MNPFSPMYFIKENKTRCVLLMFMIFLGYGIYLIGLYITNITDEWKLAIEYNKKFITVSCNDKEYLHEKIKEANADGRVKAVIIANESSALTWKSIMGFKSGNYAITFESVEGYKTYCEYMNIDCNFDNIKNGSMIMSDRFSKNLNIKKSDKIDSEYASGIYGEYTLDEITKEEGYTIYFIDEEDTKLNEAVMFIADKIDEAKLKPYIENLFSDYVESDDNSQADALKIHDNNLTDILGEQFRIFYVIYTFIVIILAVIMAVTINAAFVGMYQKRHFEFAVYRAIGISKRRTIWKISGELLLMDLISMVIGGIVFITWLYIFNNIVLYPKGLYLCYFNKTALLGLILCNVIVVVPLIITRCRNLTNADICEY